MYIVFDTMGPALVKPMVSWLSQALVAATLPRMMPEAEALSEAFDKTYIRQRGCLRNQARSETFYGIGAD